MNYSEIVFDMNADQHPISGSVKYLLKYWKKHTIYAKTGPWNRTDNPLDNEYSSNSIYLYHYMAVSKEWFDNLVPTELGEHFEFVSGYPRNHITHKRIFFSLYSNPLITTVDGITSRGLYKRCSQTFSTTIGENGLNDGSPPIQSVRVQNLDLIQSDNVINK